jgi:DhnA family fructose-bisphosphate aldolase class Ia
VTGKAIRLSRIFNNSSGRAVVVMLDDILLSGPELGLRRVDQKIKQVKAGNVDAILGFRGLLTRHADILAGKPTLMNVTASTTRMTHTRKVQVASVEQAVQMGVDAVAVHVNISSKYETEMLKTLADVSRDCDRFGMPLMGIMYARGEKDTGEDDNYLNLLKDDPEKYTELVRHAVRVGVELGADMIKTPFTGSAELFKTVVESASGIPILMAGGPKVPISAFLEKAYAVTQAGALGVCVGRNIFQRDEGKEVTIALRQIVHEGKTVMEAMKAAGLPEKTR